MHLLKNILLCCPVYSPHAGGGGQYFPLLCKNMLSVGIAKNIYVLTEYHPERSRFSNEQGVSIYRLLPQRDTNTDKSRLTSIITFIWTYIIFFSFIPFMVLSKKIDVLHYTRYLRVPFYSLTFIMLKLFKTKIVLDMRTTVEDDACIENLFGYTVMISNSMGVHQQMQKLGVSDITNKHVPNPVELPLPSNIDTVEKSVKEMLGDKFAPYLLFVGQYLERKSIDETLDAFSEFCKTNSEFHLVLVGRNMMGERLAQKILSLPNVISLGPLPRENVLALMQLSEAVLQPSKVEGIPRVSLEALALGKKVLLPPCVPEFIKSNEVFCISEVTSVEILNAIERIVATSTLPNYDLSIHDPFSSFKALTTVYESMFESVPSEI
jgi:glycosyltransferase involved in cell wall biosynthesis